jgi:hypothetical protein
MDITIVLAADLRDFENWCWENGVRRDDRSVRYASSIHAMRGLGSGKIGVVETPRFQYRFDAQSLRDFAQAVVKSRESTT